MRQNSTFVIGAISATNASQITAAFDTRGYSYARIYCLGNATTGVSTTLANHIVADSDDATNYTTISTSAYQVSYTLPTATASISTALAKMIYDVDLRGRRRYLRVQFATAATTEIIIAADLSEPSDGKTTATEVGSAFLAQI